MSMQLCSDLPLRLAVSYDLRECLVSGAQACGSVLLVLDIDEETIVA